MGLLNMRLATAIAAGFIFGLAVYYVDFYLFTELFPWFAMARNLVSIAGHTVFGLVLGLAYHVMASPAGSEPESNAPPHG